MSIETFRMQPPIKRDFIPVYVIDGTEYEREQLTKELLAKIGEIDKVAYSNFLRTVRETEESDATIRVKIFPPDRFKAILSDLRTVSQGF